ncbi:F-box protein At5g07610-like [Cornus florida]|uniref:F-box protein At5g07610-like n=1 Tax=Cornus florida TaxID=4283 RepID=UPI0028A2413B|nr:F-box protein At5g07610-like [Cornus florida]
MAPNIRRYSEEIFAAAAEFVGDNEDLVVKILLHLPAKSLIRFKSVSKAWLSLISGHRFSLLRWQFRHRQHPKITGLFFTYRSRTEIKYIPLTDPCNSNGEECESLAQFRDFSGDGVSIDFCSGFRGGGYSTVTPIVDSCNGLLLCFSRISRAYHVYNPTTKKFTTLSWPFSPTTFDLVYLAFDPLKSLHYKVVLLQRSLQGKVYLYQIHIFSSKTNAWWRPLGDPFTAPTVDFNNVNGVYCNGSIHWISIYRGKTSIYFDVDREKWCPMPSPPFNFRHFGESRGHLHIIGFTNIIDNKFSVDVFEMCSDYSKWLLKYRVDLKAMVDFVSKEMSIPYAVLGLIHGENGRDVFLLLLVGTNMILSYNIINDTFKKLDDVAHYRGSSSYELCWPNHCRMHPYIETLFPI